MQHIKVQIDDTLLLEFKDANWLHASWNISNKRIMTFLEHFNSEKLRNFSWALRIIPYSTDGNALNDTLHVIDLKKNCHYIYVSKEPGAASEIHHYTGELGLLSTNLNFFSLLHSNAAMLPPGAFYEASGFTKSFYYIQNSSSEVYYDYKTISR